MSLVILELLAVVTLVGCASGENTADKGVVSVASAGSLANLMEHKLGPAFEKVTGYKFQGRSAGSLALANQIKDKLIQPDVFISTSTNAYKQLEGQANGNYVNWYLNFASTSMVIGYSPKSPFASQFRAAAAGSVPWYQVLEQPGLRLGRTDPALDPKGVHTILVMQVAQLYYHQPNLIQKILVKDNNPAQIFPEEDLVARLSAGQLDAGYFYINEVTDVNLPYVTLPAQINLGDPSYEKFYQQAHYTNAKGQTFVGAPILYSVTIPTNVKNQAGAVAFVKYLLGSGGRQVFQSDNISQVSLKISGNQSAVPKDLSADVKK